MSALSAPKLTEQLLPDLKIIPYKPSVSKVEKGVSFGLLAAGAALMIAGLALAGTHHNFDLSGKTFTPMDLAVVGGVVALIGANRFANALQYRKTGLLTGLLALSLLFGVGALLGHQLIHSQTLREIATIGAGSVAGVILVGAIIKSALDEVRRKKLIDAIVNKNDVKEFNRLIELDPSLINERITVKLTSRSRDVPEVLTQNETLLHAAMDLYSFYPAEDYGPMLQAIYHKNSELNSNLNFASNRHGVVAENRWSQE
jgi:hypothetical protein